MVNLRNSTESYGIIAQAFHWLVALLVLAQLGIGLYAANLPVSLARLRWLSHHKSLGLAILALVLLRLGWRALNPPPGLPGSMPRWERRAALATHRLFYLLLVLAQNGRAHSLTPVTATSRMPSYALKKKTRLPFHMKSRHL